ncbi:hypothetical protein B296_00028153 [Ensete ventricosum]|uniref:Uncharacterized protein n=1 Tax=Ensete ventricosum TaxID=4639 RepID=A0A426XP57_ENSVE|nr:hypothetical protein B296_00028153 [Ensete ventricosum]
MWLGTVDIYDPSCMGNGACYNCCERDRAIEEEDNDEGPASGVAKVHGGSSNGLKPEIRGEVKARQPYTLMATISFARIQEEQLNHEVRKTRVAPRPAMPRPTAPSIVIQAPTPKKLTRDELRE